MDSHKRYTIWLLFLVAVEMLVLLSAFFYLEPLVGDETRVSGLAENDFGWNQPQKVFHGDAPRLREAYDEHSDVWVLGDSFSFAGNFGVLNYPWQTFLAAKTGFSVSTISHYIHNTTHYDPDLLTKIVNSEAFQKTPPQVLIVEVVERQLDMLQDLAGDCQVRHTLETFPRFSINPISNMTPSEVVYRNKTLPSFKDQMAYAKKYLGQLFSGTGVNGQFHSRLGLVTGKLFSSRRSDEALIYIDELNKKSWSEAKLARIQCTLVNMQNLVQKNGKTLFVAMIVPDKLTVYSRYLRDQSLANLSAIERLAAKPDLHVVRLDGPLKAAVDAGWVDVYLPNDTHWGYRGHAIAAEALAEYLKGFSAR